MNHWVKLKLLLLFSSVGQHIISLQWLSPLTSLSAMHSVEWCICNFYDFPVFSGHHRQISVNTILSTLSVPFKERSEVTSLDPDCLPSSGGRCHIVSFMSPYISFAWLNMTCRLSKTESGRRSQALLTSPAPPQVPHSSSANTTSHSFTITSNYIFLDPVGSSYLLQVSACILSSLSNAWLVGFLFPAWAC